ncbi:MAG: hypothetical protein M3Z15_08850 [Pseudomonadota bacterium]|nr:hypothetical protein [Pseudomonadota bacterium]
MSPFAETRPHVYTTEDLAEREARRRAVVFGLLFALISTLLSIGAIASLIVAWG